MTTFTTVIRLSSSLSQDHMGEIEARIGLNDATTDIMVEDGQATVDIVAEDDSDANSIARSITSDVQEIDFNAELELVTENSPRSYGDDNDDHYPSY
jgi:hypothetical protein